MTTQPNPLDAEIKAALDAYGASAKQISKALALIAGGGYKPRVSEPGSRIWYMKSASRPGHVHVVIDDGGTVVWCDCPIGSYRRPCYHGVAAILLRYAVHVATSSAGVVHRSYCPAYKGDGAHPVVHRVATKRDEVCCALDVRGDHNAYDVFARIT